MIIKTCCLIKLFKFKLFAFLICIVIVSSESCYQVKQINFTRTMAPMPIVQSGIVSVYQSETTWLNQTEYTFTIGYKNVHLNPLKPFYFINRYKNQDLMLHQYFDSYVSVNLPGYWIIAYKPVSDAKITKISISYIALQNIYSNYQVKSHMISSPILTTGSGPRTYSSGPLSISTATNSSNNSIQMSSDPSKNKILISLIGFQHSTTSSNTDIWVKATFLNTTHYTVTISTQVTDFWNNLRIQVCLINFQRFPAQWKVNYVVDSLFFLENGTNIKSLTQYDNTIDFNNVSFCMGLNGLKMIGDSKIDIYWTVYNSTAIQVNTSVVDQLRYSFIVLWYYTPLPSHQKCESQFPIYLIIIICVIGLLAIVAAIVIYKCYCNNQQQKANRQLQQLDKNRLNLQPFCLIGI